MLFELEDVTLRRAGRVVLDRASMRIPEGTACLAGPSGSGKSTVLRMLNRLADPESGSVTYRGRPVRERDPLELRREVGLVPQLPALLDGSVEENIRFAASMNGHDPDVTALLELAGLDASYADRDSAKLSVGEQQRAMLARALSLEPKVLLLDEPTSALDEETRDAIEHTFHDLRQRLGISIVLVTHDPAQAARMAEWVVRLDRGRVVSQGSVE